MQQLYLKFYLVKTNFQTHHHGWRVECGEAGPCDMSLTGNPSRVKFLELESFSRASYAAMICLGGFVHVGKYHHFLRHQMRRKYKRSTKGKKLHVFFRMAIQYSLSSGEIPRPKTHDQELLSVFPWKFPKNASQLFKEGSKAMWSISEGGKKIGSACVGSPEVARTRSWPKRCANGRVYGVLPLAHQSRFLGCQLNRGNFANVMCYLGWLELFVFFQHHLCHLIMSPGLVQVVARGRTVWNSVGSWSSDRVMLRKWIGRLRM